MKLNGVTLADVIRQLRKFYWRPLFTDCANRNKITAMQTLEDNDNVLIFAEFFLFFRPFY